MLESWKEAEAASEEEEPEENDEHGLEERFVPDAVAEVVKQEERQSSELKVSQIRVQATSTPTSEAIIPIQTTPWQSQTFDLHETLIAEENNAVCLLVEAPSQQATSSEAPENMNASRDLDPSTNIASKTQRSTESESTNI